MRTTLDIDTPVLDELKQIKKSTNEPLGRLVSNLLTEALARRQGEVAEGRVFEWISRPMGARVDLNDKEALYAELDRQDP